MATKHSFGQSRDVLPPAACLAPIHDALDMNQNTEPKTLPYLACYITKTKLVLTLASILYTIFDTLIGYTIHRPSSRPFLQERGQVALLLALQDVM